LSCHTRTPHITPAVIDGQQVKCKYVCHDVTANFGVHIRKRKPHKLEEEENNKEEGNRNLPPLPIFRELLQCNVDSLFSTGVLKRSDEYG
jgi:hypothetical protein